MPALGRLRSAGWLCLLGGLLGGSCGNPPYCVPGFHKGEAHEVSIVGPYDRNSADLGVPWDGSRHGVG